MKEDARDIDRRTVNSFQDIPRKRWQSANDLWHIVYTAEEYTTVDLVHKSDGAIVQAYEVVNDQPSRPSTDQSVDHL